MIFTGILVTLAILNFIWLILQLSSISSRIIELGYANKLIRKRLLMSGGLLLWAAYRIWG